MATNTKQQRPNEAKQQNAGGPQNTGQMPAGNRPSGSSHRSSSHRPSSSGSKTASKPSVGDSEATALGTCMTALKTLQPPARGRVVAYCCDRYNIPIEINVAGRRGDGGEGEGETSDGAVEQTGTATAAGAR